MKKFKTSVGYFAYQVTAGEMINYVKGSVGVCDHCNTFASIGILVPVLNSYICPDCFKKWLDDARYYPEDKMAEQENCDYYDSLFNPGACKICGMDHPGHLPHDPRTEKFNQYIQKKYERNPVWKDVVAHCDQDFQDTFDENLKKAGYEKGLKGEIYYGKHIN